MTTATRGGRATGVATIPPREWLTTAEAAEWVGISRDAIREAKNAGLLKAKARKGNGSTNYFRVSDLRAWVESWPDA